MPPHREGTPEIESVPAGNRLPKFAPELSLERRAFPLVKPRPVEGTGPDPLFVEVKTAFPFACRLGSAS